MLIYINKQLHEEWVKTGKGDFTCKELNKHVGHRLQEIRAAVEENPRNPPMGYPFGLVEREKRFYRERKKRSFQKWRKRFAAEKMHITFWVEI